LSSLANWAEPETEETTTDVQPFLFCAQGYPVASITVPTERSAHYGLRPPPAGSPTTMGTAPLRPADSVFVQARQAQIAQQAAISQQQQQVWCEQGGPVLSLGLQRASRRILHMWRAFSINTAAS
jgi:hypothetical protein